MKKYSYAFSSICLKFLLFCLSPVFCEFVPEVFYVKFAANVVCLLRATCLRARNLSLFAANYFQNLRCFVCLLCSMNLYLKFLM